MKFEAIFFLNRPIRFWVESSSEGPQEEALLKQLSMWGSEGHDFPVELTSQLDENEADIVLFCAEKSDLAQYHFFLAAQDDTEMIDDRADIYRLIGENSLRRLFEASDKNGLKHRTLRTNVVSRFMSQLVTIV